MLDLCWPRRRRQKDLSAFADGELRDTAADRVAERIVFDDASRDELVRVRQLDNLLDSALAPPDLSPDSGPGSTAGSTAGAQMVADTVLNRVAAPQRPIAPSRNWTPTVVASVGLLVTAGVAFAGLKRRGRI